MDLHVGATIENWSASIKLMGFARPNKLEVITAVECIVHYC